MNAFKEYLLYYRNLTKGKHNFKYIITDKFFALFPHSRVKSGNINIDVTVIVEQTCLVLTFFINGTVSIQCDVCLEDMDLPINEQKDLLVEFGTRNSDISDVDNTIIIDYSENQIQLAQHIYEYIHLSIPIKVVHPTDKNGESMCNKEMLSTLKKYQIQQSNKEIIDPRWEKLKTINN